MDESKVRELIAECRDHINAMRLNSANRSLDELEAALAESGAGQALGKEDYSCAVCGLGMKEPCEHWKAILAQPATAKEKEVPMPERRPYTPDEQQPGAASGEQTREVPSAMKKCGKPMNLDATRRCSLPVEHEGDCRGQIPPLAKAKETSGEWDARVRRLIDFIARSKCPECQIEDGIEGNKEPCADCIKYAENEIAYAAGRSASKAKAKETSGGWDALRKEIAMLQAREELFPPDSIPCAMVRRRDVIAVIDAAAPELSEQGIVINMSFETASLSSLCVHRGGPMSATIYWRPLKSGKALSNTTAPSGFQEYLEIAFQRNFPLRLTEADLTILGAAKRLSRDSNFQKEIQELIEAIEKHEEIEIWAEW